MKTNNTATSSGSFHKEPFVFRAVLEIIAFVRQSNSVFADIRMLSEQDRVLTPELAAALTQLRPQIVHHACRSGGSKCFGDTIVGALLPHAVEHVAIDLLVEKTQQSFAGATVSLDQDAANIDGKSVMRIRIGCTNAPPSKYFETTEKALIEATQLINQLVAADKCAI